MGKLSKAINDKSINIFKKSNLSPMPFKQTCKICLYIDWNHIQEHLNMFKSMSLLING